MKNIELTEKQKEKIKVLRLDYTLLPLMKKLETDRASFVDFINDMRKHKVKAMLPSNVNKLIMCASLVEYIDNLIDYLYETKTKKGDKQ